MTEGGDTKDDLQLPSGTDDAEKLAQQIKIDFDAGKELQVSVSCAPLRNADGEVMAVLGVDAKLGYSDFAQYGPINFERLTSISALLFLLSLVLFGESIPLIGWVGIVLIVASGAAATALRSRG